MLADHPGVPEAEETGSTFAENARMKAMHYARATGLTTVAEDSGLAIDVLDGAPGIHSARYNGDTYAEKFAHLFAELDRRGAVDSAARFVCALTLVRDGQVRLRDGSHRRRPHHARAARHERFRLRSDLLLSSVR